MCGETIKDTTSEKSMEERLQEQGMFSKEDALKQYKIVAEEVGYVKGGDIEILLKQYGEPIYSSYNSILQKETKGLNETDVAYIIGKMNLCIGKTYRIGSAALDDIYNGLRDIIKGLKETTTENSQLALICCEEFIENITRIVTTTK